MQSVLREATSGCDCIWQNSGHWAEPIIGWNIWGLRRDKYILHIGRTQITGTRERTVLYCHINHQQWLTLCYIDYGLDCVTCFGQDDESKILKLVAFWGLPFLTAGEPKTTMWSSIALAPRGLKNSEWEPNYTGHSSWDPRISQAKTGHSHARQRHRVTNRLVVCCSIFL